MPKLIRLVFASVLVVAFASVAHAQDEFDPRIGERMDTLLGETFDTAKNAIGLPDEQMQIGNNFIYTWTQRFNNFEICVIQLEVSPQNFGTSTSVVTYELRGNDEACLKATENLETPELQAVHAERLAVAKREAERIEAEKQAEHDRLLAERREREAKAQQACNEAIQVANQATDLVSFENALKNGKEKCPKGGHGVHVTYAIWDKLYDSDYAWAVCYKVLDDLASTYKPSIRNAFKSREETESIAEPLWNDAEKFCPPRLFASVPSYLFAGDEDADKAKALLSEHSSRR